MLELIESYYLWIKAAHVVGIVAWMAGIFYLPRLFVYHVDQHPESDTSKLFKIMEERLIRIIMVPAMVFSLATGIILATVPGVWSSGWIHLKILCVAGMVVYQTLLNHWRVELSQGKCRQTSKFFRIINEIPTILLVIIVICAIVKPF
jgi:protoporphyrinogen IX oxidase